jgi:hypothetical protein
VNHPVEPSPAKCIAIGQSPTGPHVTRSTNAVGRTASIGCTTIIAGCTALTLQLHWHYNASAKSGDWPQQCWQYRAAACGPVLPAMCLQATGRLYCQHIWLYSSTCGCSASAIHSSAPYVPSGDQAGLCGERPWRPQSLPDCPAEACVFRPANHMAKQDSHCCHLVCKTATVAIWCARQQLLPKIGCPRPWQRQSLPGCQAEACVCRPAYRMHQSHCCHMVRSTVGSSGSRQGRHPLLQCPGACPGSGSHCHATRQRHVYAGQLLLPHAPFSVMRTH